MANPAANCAAAEGSMAAKAMGLTAAGPAATGAVAACPTAAGMVIAAGAPVLGEGGAETMEAPAEGWVGLGLLLAAAKVGTAGCFHIIISCCSGARVAVGKIMCPGAAVGAIIVVVGAANVVMTLAVLDVADPPK